MFSSLTEHQEELIRRYNEPHRFYHSLRHVNALLELLTDAPVYRRDEVELAIWYHDAIYEPLAKDNEPKSAELFKAHFGEILHPLACRRVAAMIEATQRHQLPEAGPGNPIFRHDCALFLDMDLSILAADKAVFDSYEEAVRLEYHAIPADKFYPARRAILERFLTRDRIYFTDFYYEKFEARARENLKASIAKAVGE